MTGPVHIFDRTLLRQRRARMATDYANHNFLFQEIASRLAERTADVRRNFDSALDWGGRTGVFADAARRLAPEKIGQLIHSDMSYALARHARRDHGNPVVVADEETPPFAEASFDLVVSIGTLHAVNDLPGALVQLRHALKPGGLFLGAMFGGETLYELRDAWLEAEAETEGGASPRVAPFAELSDAAALLQRAGFALPVADLDTICVTYDHPLKLMHDLRGMGETNIRRDRRRTPTRRTTLFRAVEIYAERFAGQDNRIPATFEIFFLTGWSPDASQPRPLKPGSAQGRLADALETVEHHIGDAANPRPTKD
ncbi:MAG: SAM-dependent methyltransferase [Alphaproteobacteria bacterium]|nr:SAM-dependent methyltransferase [Alphaproteobacteria bacterium]HCP01339.1 SAM-dependent methyltransferase [Rhodospirillaceae bacterium]